MALTVLFVVLAGLSSGLLVARRTSEALRAQRQVDRALEASLETLRSGQIPLSSGPLPIIGPGIGFPVALQLEVIPEGSNGLHLVTVRGSYLRGGVAIERRLVSKVWRSE